MIIEVKVANYRSINAEQTLSFVAENAKRHPDNLIPGKGYQLLKAVALFGANASGKSNFVKAIKVMRDFVRDSATRMNEGDLIMAAEPYRLDPVTREGPSRFEITFMTEGVVYVYGFAVDRTRVQSEWLTARREASGVGKVCEFQRTFNADLGTDEWEFAGFKKSDAAQIMARTLQNMLAISVGTQQNVELLRPAYHYIRNNVRIFDLSTEIEALIIETAQKCRNSEVYGHYLSDLLRSIDDSIEDIHHDAVPLDLPDAQPDMSERMQDLFKTAKELAGRIRVPRISAQRRDINGESVSFNFSVDESQGTRRFFAVAGQLLDGLITGAFVVIDELSASMHPLLTRRLLELFHSAGANTNGAQLLFTTHDSSLLDQDLFRRDQIWLAEKCEGASTFFSLADVRPSVRNTESFLRNYLIGRYGGTPHLGRTFDELAAGGVQA